MQRLGLIRMCFTNHGHSCRTSPGVDARVIRIKKRSGMMSLRIPKRWSTVNAVSRERGSRLFPGSCKTLVGSIFETSIEEEGGGGTPQRSLNIIFLNRGKSNKISFVQMSKIAKTSILNAFMRIYLSIRYNFSIHRSWRRLTKIWSIT